MLLQTFSLHNPAVFFCVVSPLKWRKTNAWFASYATQTAERDGRSMLKEQKKWELHILNYLSNTQETDFKLKHKNQNHNLLDTDAHKKCVVTQQKKAWLSFKIL